jgi:hypothetical protein
MKLEYLLMNALVDTSGNKIAVYANPAKTKVSVIQCMNSLIQSPANARVFQSAAQKV